MQSLHDQERINHSVNELSAKLLEGCKLLSESCPETNVPLVLTKDGRMFSVGNQKYYRRDGGRLVVDESGAPALPLSPHRHAAPPGAGSEAGGMCGMYTMHPSAPSYAAPVAPPDAPVGRHAPALGLPTANGGGAEAHGAAARGGPSANYSSSVAQKLLEGWQLLADSCPETNVPLVQSRDGLHILSVGTGKSYARDAATGALHEVSGGGGVGAAAAPPAQYHHQHPPSPYQPTPQPPSQQQPPPQQPPPPQSSFQLQPSPGGALSAVPTPHAARAPAAGAAAGPTSAAGRLHTASQTLDVLYAKLHAAQAALGATADLQGARPLVVATHEIAAAIGAVQALLAAQPS